MKSGRHDSNTTTIRGVSKGTYFPPFLLLADYQESTWSALLVKERVLAGGQMVAVLALLTK